MPVQTGDAAHHDDRRVTHPNLKRTLAVEQHPRGRRGHIEPDIQERSLEQSIGSENALDPGAAARDRRLGQLNKSSMITAGTPLSDRSRPIAFARFPTLLRKHYTGSNDPARIPESKSDARSCVDTSHFGPET